MWADRFELLILAFFRRNVIDDEIEDPFGRDIKDFRGTKLRELSKSAC